MISCAAPAAAACDAQQRRVDGEECAMTTGPTAELDSRFSSEDANATPWADVVKVLQEAFWLSTLRAHHGHEHVGSGIDIVVEGAATRVTNDGRLAQFVGLWSRKYEWP